MSERLCWQSLESQGLFLGITGSSPFQKSNDQHHLPYPSSDDAHNSLFDAMRLAG